MAGRWSDSSVEDADIDGPLWCGVRAVLALDSVTGVIAGREVSAEGIGGVGTGALVVGVGAASALTDSADMLGLDTFGLGIPGLDMLGLAPAGASGTGASSDFAAAIRCCHRPLADSLGSRFSAVAVAPPRRRVEVTGRGDGDSLNSGSTDSGALDGALEARRLIRRAAVSAPRW
jgi:hypothetical protein